MSAIERIGRYKADLRWDESWTVVDKTRCWRVVADVRDIAGLHQAAGWEMSGPGDVAKVEVWFGRGADRPDDTTFATLRDEIGRACGLDRVEWIEGDYAKEIALEQARLLRRTEAQQVMARIRELGWLVRPRMIRQRRMHWGDCFISDLPARPWPAHVFGKGPPFDVRLRVIRLI